MIRGSRVLLLAAILCACVVGQAACGGGGSSHANSAIPVNLAPPPVPLPTPTSSDWITFAHDDQRTGFQASADGLSAANVSQLALRWKSSVLNGEGVYASPVISGTNLIIVTLRGPAVVYDLSTDTGAVRWTYQVAGEVRGTPTIDPAADLLFVADRVIGANLQPLPSFLYAIRLSTGALVWKRQLSGITHAGPLVAGGTVYQGTSGGDPPQCLNGGVTAFDELTGASKWTWDVNARTNPGGGGSVWGAIGFDGAHLIFGTGNTCGTGLLPTANGAAALDLNGNLVWSFVAQQDSYLDYDTGSSVMVSQGYASFKNKNGILYSMNATTGQLLRSTMIDPNYGYGEFPSPSTDGSVTVIGYGLNPIVGPSTPRRPPQAFQELEMRAHEVGERVEKHTRRNPFDVMPGFYSALVALNSAGGVLWTHRMNSTLDGYAAIVNDVAFADNDSALTAFDLHTGAQLWTYSLPSLPAASPAIVPSGVYAADGSGNVYAFALPGGAKRLTLKR